MGAFANSIFSLLLSWVRGAASSVWNLVFDADQGAFFRWLGDHWITVALVVCLAGMAVDMIIHQLRWRTHRVWFSFLRRLFGRKNEQDASVPLRVSREDGATRGLAVDHPPTTAIHDPRPVGTGVQAQRGEPAYARRAFRRPGVPTPNSSLAAHARSPQAMQPSQSAAHTRALPHQPPIGAPYQASPAAPVSRPSPYQRPVQPTQGVAAATSLHPSASSPVGDMDATIGLYPQAGSPYPPADVEEPGDYRYRPVSTSGTQEGGYRPASTIRSKRRRQE